MIGKTTETADMSQWEVMDYGLTAGEPAWHWTKPSECRWQLCGLMCLGVQVVWALAVTPGPIPSACTGFLEFPRSALTWEGGAWSCLKLVSQTFLTPQRKNCPLWEEDGEWEGEVWRGDREGRVTGFVM